MLPRAQEAWIGWRESSKRPSGLSNSGEQDEYREADGGQSVHPGEKMTEGIFFCVSDYLIGTNKNVESDDF